MSAILDELLARGGPSLVVLAALSVLAVAVVLERGWFWGVRALVGRRRDIERAIDSIEARSFAAATATLARLPRVPLARVLLEGLRHRGAAAAGRLEAAARREHDAMVRNTGVLETITAVAPLVGILGTVLGIIRSFHGFGAGGAVVPPPHLVIGGVSEALVTTGAGLVVALVALVFAAALRGLADRGTTSIELAVTAVEPLLAEDDRAG